MARSFARYLSLEMVLLCLVELLLSFALIYGMLAAAREPELSIPGQGYSLPLLPGSANLAAMLAFTIAAAGVTIGLYQPRLSLQRRHLPGYAVAAGAVAFAAIVLLSETLQIRLSQYYILWVCKVLLAWGGCLLLSRWVFAVVVRHRLFVRSVLVVGRGERGTRIAETLRDQRGRLFDLAGVLDTNEANSLDTRLRQTPFWAVVVAAEDRAAIPVEHLLALRSAGVHVFGAAAFWERHLGRMDLAGIGPDWVLQAEGLTASRTATALRRAVDLALSGVSLVFALPVMLIVAALIKLDDPRGPVFYRQARVGLGGRVFTLLKFRSMRVNAEAAGEPRWAARRDPRVTRIGGVLRGTRIDELPQLVNVLRGEMSFIGPRPERPAFVGALARDIPGYLHRNDVKPGITGWAQINFPYAASVEDARQKLSYDLYYVKHRSLFLDLLILVSTLRVILFQVGAR